MGWDGECRVRSKGERFDDRVRGYQHLPAGLSRRHEAIDPETGAVEDLGSGGGVVRVEAATVVGDPNGARGDDRRTECETAARGPVRRRAGGVARAEGGGDRVGAERDKATSSVALDIDKRCLIGERAERCVGGVAEADVGLRIGGRLGSGEELAVESAQVGWVEEKTAPVLPCGE